MLRPNGHFVFDVFAPASFSGKKEAVLIEQNLMNGFWSERDYVGLQNTVLYPEALLSLERYMIIQETESFQIYNWLQHFTPEAITAELAQAGFEVELLAGSLTGDVLRSDSETIGIIAQKR